jgi:kinetochore protein Spc25
MKKKDIEILNLKSASHAQSLQKEAQETSEMHAAISAISAQRDDRAAARDRLRQQIAETQKLIAQRQEAQRKHAEHLDSQARFNVPELDFWQDYLCLQIEGAGKADHLKFVFTHLDDRNWEREAWVELSVGKREYEVLHVRPKLKAEQVEKAIDKLNETRSLGLFLKMLRDNFVEAMK